MGGEGPHSWINWSAASALEGQREGWGGVEVLLQLLAPPHFPLHHRQTKSCRYVGQNRSAVGLISRWCVDESCCRYVNLELAAISTIVRHDSLNGPWKPWHDCAQSKWELPRKTMKRSLSGTSLLLPTVVETKNVFLSLSGLTRPTLRPLGTFARVPGSRDYCDIRSASSNARAVCQLWWRQWKSHFVAFQKILRWKGDKTEIYRCD